jgi:hypothetical protein
MAPTARKICSNLAFRTRPSGWGELGSFDGARMGSHFAGTQMGRGFAREFHGHHRGRFFSPGYAYDDGYGWDCSPYKWQYSWQWPNACY